MILGTKYNYSYELASDTLTRGKQFKDDKINVNFEIGEKQIEFALKNLTVNPIRINWDEVSFIKDGISHRVIHKGIRLIEKDAPQASSVIPPLTEINELVVPVDNIAYSAGYYSAYSSIPGGWTTKDLFLYYDMNREDYKKFILENNGKTFKLFMPIELNGVKLNYMFEFKVNVKEPVKK
jgi:hypothetical protein